MNSVIKTKLTMQSAFFGCLGEFFMNPDPSTKVIKVSDMVEILDAPFRGSQAEVIRIDYTKNEATVKSLNPIIRIPIVLRIGSIQIFEN